MDTEKPMSPPTSQSPPSPPPRTSRSDMPDLEQLPRRNNFVNYEGFWYPSTVVAAAIDAQRHFQAHSSDIMIASNPKTGTTWLKSLLFSTIHRHRNPLSASPLLLHHPHDLIVPLETTIYLRDPNPDLDSYCPLGPPRIFSTHIPYGSLPTSMKDNGSGSGCKIVYISRNPMDTLVSGWHFFKEMHESETFKAAVSREVAMPTFDEYFERFCQGVSSFGPFFEHVLGYWEQSHQNPSKVLFLKYEDLKENPVAELKKLADFIGCPFTDEEEQRGAIQEIIKLCDIKNMKGVEANKSGVIYPFFEKKTYFRKGKVGDWTNYLTPSMADRLRELTREKFHGSGLSFKEV